MPTIITNASDAAATAPAAIFTPIGIWNMIALNPLETIAIPKKTEAMIAMIQCVLLNVLEKTLAHTTPISTWPIIHVKGIHPSDMYPLMQHPITPTGMP